MKKKKKKPVKKYLYQAHCPDEKTRERIRYAVKKMAGHYDYEYHWEYLLNLIEADAQRAGVQLKDE